MVNEMKLVVVVNDGVLLKKVLMDEFDCGIDTFVPVEVFNSINEVNIKNPPLNGTHTPVFSNDEMSSSTTPSRIRVSSASGTPVSKAGSALGVRSLLVS